MAEKYTEQHEIIENPPKIKLCPAAKAYQSQTCDKQGDRHKYATGDMLEVLWES
jgi:hypothetical protein